MDVTAIRRASADKATRPASVLRIILDDSRVAQHRAYVINRNVVLRHFLMGVRRHLQRIGQSLLAKRADDLFRVVAHFFSSPFALPFSRSNGSVSALKTTVDFSFSVSCMTSSLRRNVASSGFFANVW